MDKARLLFSRKGELKETISCFDITSREHYRNLWPLVSADDPPRQVCWVSPVFEGGELKRRSYFREYSGKRKITAKTVFDTEEEQRGRQITESAEHLQAKRLIAAELRDRIARGKALPWSFKDPSLTDFHLEGDLLLAATSVETEYPIKAPPPLSSAFRLDVAVLGPVLQKNRIILAGIEIEYGHAFDGRKAIAGRATGYPLISIDISDMTLQEITPEWAKRALTDTTTSGVDGRRKTFVYLNPLLYPLYIRLPHELFKRERRHQFVIFAQDDELQKIKERIETVRARLKLTEKDVVLQLPTGSSEQAKKMVANLGAIVGDGWTGMNSYRCLTVSLDRPLSRGDQPRHLMHLFLAIYLAGWCSSLVGYKWRMGVTNDYLEEDLWKTWYEKVWHWTAPKRLAIPFSHYLATIDKLSGGRELQPFLLSKCLRGPAWLR
ncbi:hypothetical protein [Pseudomonas aeruginosa]|uniref:hypothetical protein n=1 Tax=Pseudomonas aeruginosa TaxID=287 RepID=UPI003CF33F8D